MSGDTSTVAGDGTVSKRSTPIVYLTRVESFSACHRLHSPQLNDQENQRIFGKCNNLHGHGHNYKVAVTVKGKVDQVTGMVMNLTDLKTHIKNAVMDLLDHKNLDQDVPYFKHTTSTVENIAAFIWMKLSECLEENCLHEIKVHETDKNIATFRGEFQ